MLYLLSGIISLLAFCTVRNKKISYLFLTLMVFMGGLCYNNADYLIYEDRFNKYDSDFLAEPIFNLIMKLLNNLNLNYEQARFIIIFLVLLSFFFFTLKMTKNVNIVLLLYFIYPFCMDITQLRFSMGLAVYYWGLYFILNKEKILKKDIFLYCFFTIIGGLIHSSIFLYLFLLIPILIKNKKTKTIVFLIFILAEIIFVGINETNYMVSGNTLFEQKINSVLLRTKEDYSLNFHFGYMLTVLFTFLIYYLFNKILIRKIKADDNTYEINFINKVFDINLYILLIIPLMIYIIDLYRLQTGLLLLDYVSLSYFFDKRDLKGSFIIKLLLLILPLFVLYRIVLVGVSDLVLLPLFENNLLLK